MLCGTGHIFHIDFGFAFGEDPHFKLGERFKFTPDMVIPLGGVDSEQFWMFRRRSIDYYNL